MAFPAATRHSVADGRIIEHVCAVLKGRLKKTVVLVGMMGSGKTAVGQALARMLGVAFLDSDAEIVTASNLSIAEIFERYGEPFFREKEAQVIRRLLESGPSVLSTGGGAYLAAENREVISELGVAVWLRADVDLLWQRVRHKNTRPLLRTADPYGTLRALCQTREPFYARADLVADARSDYAIDDMAQSVLRVLARRPDVLEAET